MAESKLRGHCIIYIDNKWLYADTMTPTAGNRRQCKRCDKPETSEGHDHCLGTIVGVMNTCCGHGEKAETYIQYWDGSCIRGDEAIAKLREMKNK